MNKEMLIKKLEELKAQGKQPHGLLRDLLIDLEIEEENSSEKD